MNAATSNITDIVNNAFMAFVLISIFFLVLITFLMIFFTIKYSKKRHPKASQIHGNTLLEITWIVVPTIIVLGMFYYGYVGFKMMRDVPEDAMVVTVTGRMWDWSFLYANGKRSDKLYVPLGKPVKVVLKSVDVIHSFFIPAFRVKQDAVPGRETYLWFKPQSIGPADIFCAEYCGASHAYMLSEVIVMEEQDFAEWYEGTTVLREEREQRGLELLKANGCLACHRMDGTEDNGPTFKGLYGKKRYVLENGRDKEVTADEAYLREAILHPGSQVVKGFMDIMPLPEELSEEDIPDMIDYLRTVQ